MLFAIIFSLFLGGKQLSPVTTLLSVLLSKFNRAFFAIAPPFLLAFLFSLNPVA